MKKLITGWTTLALIAFNTAACGSESSGTANTTATTTTTAVLTTTTQSEADRKEDLRKKLDAVAPINQVNEGNLRNACIMAISKEIPNAGNFDFPVPINMGEPDSAGIYSDGGNFRYEEASESWNDAAYFCTIYTENGSITDSSAVVTG